MSHEEGADPGVKRENARLYVSAYFIDRLNRLVILSASCGEICCAWLLGDAGVLALLPTALFDRTCAIVAFSSANKRCSSPAINEESGELDASGRTANGQVFELGESHCLLLWVNDLSTIIPELDCTLNKVGGDAENVDGVLWSKMSIVIWGADRKGG